MRAAVVRQFGGIENIAIEADFPIPEITEKQVLVNVKASGVNPVDTYIRAGTYAQLPHLPYSPGREGAGVVNKVGAEVTNWKEGDRVWFVNPVTGPSADYSVVDERLVFKLPESISFIQGSTLGVAYFTAYKSLFMKAGAQAGQTVFIHGISGGVGLAAAQIAKAHGLRVFGTAGSEEGAELARQNGAEKVFNHREEGYVAKIQEEFPNGFDNILEMLANVNLSNDLQLVACQGRIVVVGNRGTIEIDPRKCMQKEASIIGVMGGLTSVEDYQRMGERLVGLLEGGHIAPFVGQVLPLSQLPEAHRILSEGKAAHGKIVINLELD